jgi:hypothetical protein
MPFRFDTALWRSRALSALAQLTLIFVGVTLAFVFEGWRKQLDEAADVRQTVDGLITELRHYDKKSVRDIFLYISVSREKGTEADGGRPSPSWPDG